MTRSRVNPNSPEWERARGILVELLREIGEQDSRNGYTRKASYVAAAQSCDIPSWIVLELLAETLARGSAA